MTRLFLQKRILVPKIVTGISLVIIFIYTAFFSVPTITFGSASNYGSVVKLLDSDYLFYIGYDSTFDRYSRYIFVRTNDYDTFSSWYFDESLVKIISSSEMNSYPVRGNALIRPGTELLRITSDPKIYLVEPDRILRWIGTEASPFLIEKIYGSNWQSRLITLADVDYVNYTAGNNWTSESQHPEGTLIQYAGSSDIYLISNNQKRKFQGSGFEANRYHAKYIVTDVDPSDFIYPDGMAIVDQEPALINVAGDVISNLQISNFQISNIDGFLFTISWTTNKPTRSIVYYDIDETIDRSSYVNKDGLNYETNHEFTMPELRNNTTYYFIMSSTDTNANTVESEIKSFTTAILYDWVISDLQLDQDNNYVQNDLHFTYKISNDSGADQTVEYRVDLYWDDQLIERLAYWSVDQALAKGVWENYAGLLNSQQLSVGSHELKLELKINGHDDALSNNIVTKAVTVTEEPLSNINIFNVSIVEDSSDATVQISWETDLLSNTWVLYDKNQTYSLAYQEDSQSSTNNHSVTLDHLDIGATYYFKLSSRNESTNQGGEYFGSFFNKSSSLYQPVNISFSDVRVPEELMIDNTFQVLWNTDVPVYQYQLQFYEIGSDEEYWHVKSNYYTVPATAHQMTLGESNTGPNWIKNNTSYMVRVCNTLESISSSVDVIECDVDNPFIVTYKEFDSTDNGDNNSPAEQKILDRIRDLDYQISELERKVIKLEKSLVGAVDVDLISRLKGRILLQVEENGEAWYVDEDTEKKFYLKDGESAYIALNAFGLGITNEDLSKIPIGIEDRAEVIDTDNDGLDDKLEEALGTDINNPDTDGDGFLDGDEVRNGFNPLGAGALGTDSQLANDLKGKILLQVESRGEAWYINPVDGKRYYMKDGEQAYQIMRFLSLGITNTDLRKIAVGEFE